MLSELLAPLATKISDLIDQFGYLGIVFATFIENIIAPIPSEFLFPWAGFLASQGRMNIWYISLAGAIGSLIAAIILYYLGYMFNGPKTKEFVEKYGKYVFISYDDLKRAEKWFDKYSIWTVLLFRFVPLGRTVVSVPAGFFKMNFGLFCLFTFIGTFIWSFVLTYAGYQLGENWVIISDILGKYENFVLVAIVILFGVFLYLKVWRGRGKKKVNTVTT